uniref:(northern house mosquito) hypothetical protein n=1 Tax=Culex pipiens TaxID=7175 RepID=A0A8D8ACG2_CULPI
MLPDGRTAAGHGPADGPPAGPNPGRATGPQRWRSGPRTATLVDRLRFVDRIDELHTGHLVYGTTTTSKITYGSGTSRRGATSWSQPRQRISRTRQPVTSPSKHQSTSRSRFSIRR